MRLRTWRWMLLWLAGSLVANGESSMAGESRVVERPGQDAAAKQRSIARFGRTDFSLGKEEAQAQEFTIAGTVVSATTGAPLARVTVSIADARSRSRMIETQTGESGHFEFAGVPAGKYTLQGVKRGYMTSGYEQHEQYSTAIVTGPEFATEALILRLMPLAMIKGHVLDEAGETVRNARLQLFMEDHSGGMSRVTSAGGATSDDRGYFDISVLQPGTYFLSVSATPWYAVHAVAAQGAADARLQVPASLDVAYPTTYYGGATESEGAAAIELKGGDKKEVDVRLTPVPALHLVFHVPSNDQREEHRFYMPILLKRVFDSEQPMSTGGFGEISPGVIELTGVPAGQYNVRIASSNPNELQRISEMNLLHDELDLDGTQGEALGELKVKVKMPGDDPLPRQYAIGLRDAHEKVAAFHQGDASGTVSFAGVRPGKYALVFAAPGKLYSVAQTISGSGNVAGHEVSVASGAALEVTAQLAGGEVRIDGVAEKNGKPAVGVMVALVPNDPEAHLELFRRDQSDFDGTFSLQGVVPGSYTVVAVENAWGFDWLKSGVLARYIQHGRQVNVVGTMRGVLKLPDAVEVQGR